MTQASESIKSNLQAKLPLLASTYRELSERGVNPELVDQLMAAEAVKFVNQAFDPATNESLLREVKGQA